MLAWAFEKHGTYSVRSAYRLLKQEQTAAAMALMGESSGSESAQCWSTLWKMEVPPQIRVFWWRVIHNSLPSKAELKRRHIENESFCEVCGDPDETLFHVFFQCPVAKNFWQAVKEMLGISIPNFHPCSWATDVFRPDVCTFDKAQVMLCGAWALWTGGNARRHGRKVWEPSAMARYISKLLEDLASLKLPVQPKRIMAEAKWGSGRCRKRAGQR